MSSLVHTQTKPSARPAPSYRAYRLRAVPPLESGDHLSRTEFEKRYETMPDVKKAELVEGIVHIPSPVHYQHGRPHAMIMGWLAVYDAATPAVESLDNISIRLDIDNEYQPDALLRLTSEVGGRTHVAEDGYLEGAPELIVEIAATSAKYDLYDKKRVYRRTGVQEYVVWRVYDAAIDWFRLVEGEYQALALDGEGIYHSLILPGLWLAVEPLLQADLAGALAVLQQGLESEEHKTFVDTLAPETAADGK
ncbi:MAG: Uma2 family endonuclease [Halieaceae bacterium]|nr:Uma2 family endonuclease [Halieaceae bacterium]